MGFKLKKRGRVGGEGRPGEGGSGAAGGGKLVKTKVGREVGKKNVGVG